MPVLSLRAIRREPYAVSMPAKISRLVAHVFRWPVATPVRTSFGTMRDRPMVLVEAVDEDGISGWGEVWCNFPSVGAEHRARLVSNAFAPGVVGRVVEDPAAIFRELTEASAVSARRAARSHSAVSMPAMHCATGPGSPVWIATEQFDAAHASGAFAVLQPDVAKWGGISGCLPVARRIRAGGQRYCPHFLGGGIGLLASAHLLAAVGGDGMLEIDANPNPLRTEICGPLATVVDGHATLTDASGLGIVPDLAMLRGLAAA